MREPKAFDKSSTLPIPHDIREWRPRTSNPDGNIAVFLDRDGTICKDVHYMSKPEQFALLHGAAEGVKLLNDLGLPVIVATNQSGIARGYFTENDLEKIHRRMAYDLHVAGARLDAIYHCPHHPNDGCNCRKPKVGMLLRAESDFNLDLESCFMIGDRELDVKAGWNAGCTTILVPSPETEKRVEADYVVPNLYEAAELIGKTLPQKLIEATKSHLVIERYLSPVGQA